MVWRVFTLDVSSNWAAVEYGKRRVVVWGGHGTATATVKPEDQTRGREGIAI